jgi:hypothetical protein
MDATPDITPPSGMARIRGWLMIALGLFLSIGMALFGAYLGSIIANNDQPGGTHWTGSHDFTAQVFKLLAIVFVFGLVSVGGGVFQLRRGRPSWPITIVLLGLVAAMFLIGHGLMNSAK